MAKRKLGLAKGKLALAKRKLGLAKGKLALAKREFGLAKRILAPPKPKRTSSAMPASPQGGFRRTLKHSE